MKKLLCLLVLLPALAFGQSSLRQSDAIELYVGPFVDSTDGVTAETGLTISQADVRLTKCTAAGTCAAAAQKSDTNACSHVENGWYECAFNTTDTDTVGLLTVAVNESGALPVWKEYMVVEEAIYDAFYAGSATGLLPANVTQFGGSNGTFSGGRPEVNATLVEGSDATNQIRDSLVDDATRIDASALNTASGTTIPTNLDATVSSRASQASVDDVPTNAELAAALGTADDAVLAAIAALNNLSTADVRDLVIEDQGGGVSLGCAISVVLAYAAGDIATSGGNTTYEEASGTETRITGTVASAGNRTASITCPTY